MINFSTLQALTIPEGEVSMIARGAEILWQKQQEQKYKRELLYLEGTGKQYINIGVVFKNTDECYLEATILSTQGDKYCIAPTTWNNNSNRFAMAGRLSNAYCAAYGSVSTSFSKYLPETAVDSNKHIFTYKDKLFTIEDLGATYDATKNSWGGDTTELRLFYGYNAPTQCRIYAYKQKRDGKLIRDFIPVLDWDDVPCMYDKVSGELFYNQGTGVFAYAELSKYKTELAYLESADRQYIDTGYMPSNKTELEMIASEITQESFAFSASGTWFFGARAGYLNKAFGSYYNPTSDTLYYAFGNIMPSAVYTTLYESTKTIQTKATGLYIDGKQIIPLSANNFTAPVPLTLFALNNNGQVISYTSYRIHSCKIWNDGVLVRDYIPVLDWDDRPCMYDKVTEELFYNQGTGEFSYQEIQ